MNYSTARAHSEDRRQRDLQNFLSFELVRHSLLHLLPPAPALGSNGIINFYFTRTRATVHPMSATSDPAHAHVQCPELPHLWYSAGTAAGEHTDGDGAQPPPR